MDPQIKKLGEFGLIEHLVKRLPPLPPRRWIAGIGDDSSVLKLQENHYQLFTQDLLLEGVHFRVESSRNFFRDLGWKALAVNLSDIAAMGGLPQEAVVGLGIPTRARLRHLESLYDGLAECAQVHHCPISGGDTNHFKSAWVISIALTGYAPRIPKLRSGTRPGDGLWVTGCLGRGGLGWAARQKADASSSTAIFKKWHARPEPRLSWGQSLGELAAVKSMMDTSDGLASDLRHIMAASEVGFELDLEAIPRDPQLASVCQRLKLSEAKALLASGEDYELIFTLAQEFEGEMASWLKKRNISATRIGRATIEKQLVVRRNSRPVKRIPVGYTHF